MTNPPVGGDGFRLPASSDEQHPLDRETLRRLHGEACVRCGAETDLSPAGYAYTTSGDGNRYGWPVVTCAEHTGT